jgi:hypothetical protein
MTKAWINPQPRHPRPSRSAITGGEHGDLGGQLPGQLPQRGDMASSHFTGESLIQVNARFAAEWDV